MKGQNMKLMTRQEQNEWLQEQIIDGSWPNITMKHHLRFRLTTDSCRRRAFSRYIASIFEDKVTIFAFHGEVSPSCSLEFLFRKFRASASFDAALNTHPFHIIQKDEGPYLDGLLALALFAL